MTNNNRLIMLRDYIMDYRAKHLFMKPKNIAAAYDNTPAGYKPPRGLIYIFGQILAVKT